MKFASIAAVTANRAIALPHFPDDEGPLIRRLQARRDADQLAYGLGAPLERRIERDTITLGRTADGRAVLAGVADTPTLPLTDDPDAAAEPGAEFALPTHAAAGEALKRAVWQAHQGRLPVAWACDTRVYERDDHTLFAKSEVVARDEGQFGNFAVRPNAAVVGRSVLVQRLFARGTYVAADVRTLGNPADTARYLAHLDCLLGPVGDQLLRDYDRLPSPARTGQEVVRWPLLGVTAALLYGALYANALADTEVRAPEVESRAFHALHNVLLGCCIAYGALGLVALGVALRRRPEHRHVLAFGQIRASHERLLQAPRRTADNVRAELQRSRDAVAASNRRWGWSRKVTSGDGEEDGATLPLRTVAEQAFEELQAYWGVAADDGAA